MVKEFDCLFVALGNLNSGQFACRPNDTESNGGDVFLKTANYDRLGRQEQLVLLTDGLLVNEDHRSIME